jgi:hypothetical protein
MTINDLFLNDLLSLALHSSILSVKVIFILARAVALFSTPAAKRLT